MMYSVVKHKILFCCLIILSMKSIAIDEVAENILLINDPLRQGEQWAYCSAAYKVYAAILDVQEKPSSAESLRGASNGAAIAIAMSIYNLKLKDIVGTTRFNDKNLATWELAIQAMKEWPKMEENNIYSAIESDQEEGLERLSINLETCANNVSAQKMWVDLYRTMRMEGMLTE